MAPRERVKRWAATMMFMVAALSCQAGLEWQTLRERQQAEIGQDAAKFVFRFHNAGTTPVRLVSIEPSCHCVAVTCNHRVCAPGESGEIRATIDLDGMMGSQTRAITVATDEPNTRPVNLALVIDVPEFIAIAPRLLIWRVGELATEKTVSIKVTDPAKVIIRGVQPSGPGFTATLESGATAGQFQLRIKPTHLTAGERAVIRLDVTVANRLQPFLIYAAIK